MSKIKLTLKLRVMIITIIMIIITGAVLLTTINHDITRSMAKLNDTINSGISMNNNQKEFVKDNIVEGEEDKNVVEVEEFQGDNKLESSELIQVAVNNTRNNMYTTSIVSFFIIVIIGAIGAYFMANRVLKPIIELNEDIKRIDVNNLEHNLEADGAYDEIRELKISFNKMIGKLNNAFDSQKRFNSNVAHELKTPLAVIKTNIDVLNAVEYKSEEEYKKTLDIVEKSVVKMNSMIEALLDIIKQENAPLDDNVDLTNIITDLVDDLKIIANKKKVKLEFDISNNLSEFMGNEILLYRAIYNVVDNSIKYNKENGEVNIVCSEDNGYITIIVSDTGKGIADDEIHKIFNQFYRCEGNNVSSNNGVGLGLALTKSAIEIHGGEINVNSILGVGTTFRIRLPKNI